MKVLCSIVVCVIAFASIGVAQSDIKLKVGAKLPRKYALESEGQMATHPSQLRPFIKKTIARVKYTIAFDEENRKIRYIHTVDRAFRTANGLHIGSKIKVTRKQVHSFGGLVYVCRFNARRVADHICRDRGVVRRVERK